MAAGRYNFTIEQGATVDFEIAYKDSNGDPIDLTDYQARMQLRPTRESDTVYITLSSSFAADGTGLHMDGAGDLNNPASGTIGIYISANSSSMLDFSRAYYDLEIATGSTYPVVTRVLEGVVVLSDNVTLGSY